MNTQKPIGKLLFILTFFLLLSCGQKHETGQWTTEKLSEKTFKNPDKTYYPETWFHFIGGNVSKEGITADLEAIAEAGFSGIQLFHGQFGGEWPGVSPQIKCLSESWDDLIKWSAGECKRLNLHFTMQNCPGWSYAGGPWIEPENSMRHLVYSRTDINGDNIGDILLEKPQPSNEEWRDYRDLFVIAFPTPEGDTGSRAVPKRVTGNSELQWHDCLIEQKRITIPPSLQEPAVVEIEFEKEKIIRTVEFPSINSFSHDWCYSPDVYVKIYAVPSGEKTLIAELDMPPGSWQDDKPVTIACKEVSAKKYMVEISNRHEMALSFLNLYTAARQQNWESEAAWTLRRIVREDFPKQTATTRIGSSEILNLTGNFDSSGLLKWDAPEGDWTILRIGHINTGMKNGPAPAEATGWESTKLNVSGIRANFDGYIGRLISDNGVLKDGLLNGILLDSWECKTQTWTDGLDKIFGEKWDYSLFSMFPALFGYVVNAPESTALFLRDWRVTLNDLLVENFFGEIGKIARSNNLRISFETASGDIFPGDILEYYKHADIPMCEFWHPRMDSFVGSFEFKPVKPTVSAAHVYGKKRVAAEAFTSFNLTWDEHPRFLKDIIDIHFAEGVTHPVFHTFTHNPRTDFLPPGSSFGSGIGTPFLRLQTWWKDMPHFNDYLARCTYMLESGRPVSDVLMYLGDEQNHKPKQSLKFPDGYSYDYCNPDVLLNRLTVKNGNLTTPEGNSYRILWLYDCKRMLPETLEKIISLVNEGAVVAGLPPDNIATLSGDDEYRRRFEKAVEELWGNKKENVRNIGKGKVYLNFDKTVLESKNILPQIVAGSPEIRWLQRQTSGSDLFFLSLPPEKGFEGNVTFRSNKNIIEFWNPITGEITQIEPRTVSNETSTIALNMPAGTSGFVVFKNRKSAGSKPAPNHADKKVLNLTWEIFFPEGWGIDKTAIATNKLLPWKELKLSEEGRVFSGTAVYKTKFDIDKIEKGKNYILDLGNVEVSATVKLNGKNAGTMWSHPYRTDITNYIMSGSNSLEIEVTGTWFNRLAYDAGLPENERKTWTISGPPAGAELKEYGLTGPVSLITAF